MGLSQNAYVFGWMLTSYVKVLPIALIILMSIYYSTNSENLNNFLD